MSHWIFSLYLSLLIMASVVALIVVVMALRMPETPGGIIFIVLMSGVAIWCLGGIVELFARTIDGKMLGCQLQYLGIATIPLNWFLLIVRYLQQDFWLTKPRLLLLWLVPCLTIALIWTNNWHHLMYARLILSPSHDLPYWNVVYGPWFLVHIIYSWLLVAAGIMLIIQSLNGIAPFYRRQTISLLVVALVPFLVNIVYVLRLGPFRDLDLTPIAFSLSGMCLLLAIRYFRVIDIAPIARNAVFESMPDGVIVLDSRRRILDTNPALRAILGKKADDLYGTDAAALCAPWLPKQVFNTEVSMHTVQLTDSAGTERWFDLRTNPLIKQQGWLLVLRDSTDLHELQERLNTLAYYDSLTGLPNRVLANDRMVQELARVKRRQSRTAVMYLDVDGFKKINDTLGHATGDRLLNDIAQRLLSCIREGDTVARVGGDEFILMVSDLPTADFARASAKRILVALTKPYQLADHAVSITVSIGIAIAPDDGLEVETLVSQADNAMYQAKKNGKNAFVFYRELADLSEEVS